MLAIGAGPRFGYQRTSDKIDFASKIRVFVTMNDFTLARAAMVDCQIRPNGITEHRIIAAMGEVPREAFVLEAHRAIAYIDKDILLARGEGDLPPRFLMEPVNFARLLQLAEISRDDLVLDVGCASGYSTAVIARLAQSVIALESDGELARRAVDLLAAQGVMNAVVVTGSFAKGYTSEGPYDAIVVNGALSRVPPAFLDQLAEGGRLVAVIRSADTIGKITLYTRHRSVIASRQAYDAYAPFLIRDEPQEAHFVF